MEIRYQSGFLALKTMNTATRIITAMRASKGTNIEAAFRNRTGKKSMPGNKYR